MFVFCRCITSPHTFSSLKEHALLSGSWGGSGGWVWVREGLARRRTRRWPGLRAHLEVRQARSACWQDSGRGLLGLLLAVAGAPLSSHRPRSPTPFVPAVELLAVGSVVTITEEGASLAFLGWIASPHHLPGQSHTTEDFPTGRLRKNSKNLYATVQDQSCSSQLTVILLTSGDVSGDT